MGRGGWLTRLVLLSVVPVDTLLLTWTVEHDIRKCDPKLAEVVRQIVEAFQSERVYLFGSLTRGEAGLDSDYDLLVVVRDDTLPERKRSRPAYEALRGTGTPWTC